MDSLLRRVGSVESQNLFAHRPVLFNKFGISERFRDLTRIAILLVSKNLGICTPAKPV